MPGDWGGQLMHHAPSRTRGEGRVDSGGISVIALPAPGFPPSRLLLLVVVLAPEDCSGTH